MREHFRSINQDPQSGRVRVQTVNRERSMTDQSFKDHVDVNRIIDKYKKTGQWLHMTGNKGVYADVSKITDYQQCLEKVMMANEAFMLLPAKLRDRFQNDPSQLLDFLQNSSNRDEAVELGLIDRPDKEPKEIKNMTNDLTNDKINVSSTGSSEAKFDDKNLLSRFQDFIAKNPQGSTTKS